MTLNTTDMPGSGPAPSGPDPGGMPPWLDPSVQQGVVARDGDIWISVPIKSGTNWMMNIVHQLVTGGDDDFDSIYRVVPWPEFVERPGQPPEEVLGRIAAMPSDRRRAFKTHSAPPDVPFVSAGSGKDVKYIVVCRNPEEALVSFKVFLEQHTDAFYELWQVPKAAMTRPDFQRFYREVVEPGGMQGLFFGFVAAWWPLRHEPNVLLLHFADLKKDLSGCMRRVASFLEIEPEASQWPLLEERCSFEWMKANEAKFDTHPFLIAPILERGGMIRKGKAGAAREDGMTPEIARDLRGFGSQILTDEAAMAWLYSGGEIT